MNGEKIGTKLRILIVIVVVIVTIGVYQVINNEWEHDLETKDDILDEEDENNDEYSPQINESENNNNEKEKAKENISNEKNIDNNYSFVDDLLPLEYNNSNYKLARGYDPVFSPDGRIIVFFQNESLFVMKANGSSQTQISNDSFSGTDICIDPNNEWLVYHKKGEIWKMRINGTDDQFVTIGRDPEFSPDGKQILFIRTEDFKKEPRDFYGTWNDTLRIININENESFVITQASSLYHIRNPRFFPNGTRVLYCLENEYKVVERRGGTMATRKGTGQCSTWTINVDGTDDICIANDGANSWGGGYSITITKKGEKILWFNNTNHHWNTMMLMDFDGSNKTRLIGFYYYRGADISYDAECAFISLLNESDNNYTFYKIRVDESKEDMGVQGMYPICSPTTHRFLYWKNGEIWSVEYS